MVPSLTGYAISKEDSRPDGVIIMQLEAPGVFGVFYYRSANVKTLEMLSRFLPVPVEALKAEFAEGATPVDVCARTIRTLIDLGAKHFYVSNLPIRKASATLNTILEKVGIPLWASS